VHTLPWTLVVLAFAAAEIVRRLRVERVGPSTLSRARNLITAPAAFVLGTLSAALVYLLVNYPEIGIGHAPLSPDSISALWPFAIARRHCRCSSPLAFPAAATAPDFEEDYRLD